MKISVIIPVYNAENTLARCVESVLSQTFTDFELLLIDDGSRDGSAALCDDYAAKDGRVRVFHKENGGVSSARCKGVEMSRGQWVTFVDADDCLRKGALATFVANVSDEVDIVVGFHYPERNMVGMVEAEEYRRMSLAGVRTTPWGKLFRKTIFTPPYGSLMYPGRWSMVRTGL